MKQTATKTDVYDQITTAIIEAIETGTAKYEMPWHCWETPINAFTKKRYRGANTLMLWAAAARRGYSSQEWATYRQWSEAGAQVRKGEKSTIVVFWKFYDDTETESEDDAPESTNPNGRCFARAYSVFNANQVEGYEAVQQPTLGEDAPPASGEFLSEPSRNSAFRRRSRVLLTSTRRHPNASLLAIQVPGRLRFGLRP